MPFTIPSGTKVAGVTLGLTSDLNNLYAAVPPLTGINVQNTAYAGGADPTGVADSTSAIQAAINAVPAGGGDVYFPPGIYKTTVPLTVSTSYTRLRGPGYGYAATIQSAATTPQTAMITVFSGLTAATAPQQVNIRDLALKGNANSGHGILWRGEVGLIEHVTIQNVSGDGVHCSWDGLSTAFLDSLVMINCYVSTPGSNGILIDQYLTSSEFFACHFAGGNAGVYGMNISGGDLKFVACHPFQFASGGMLLTSTGREIQILGGEYETNLGPGIDINAGYDIRVIGVSCYGNTTRDIYLRGTCKNVEIASSDFLSAINTGVELTGAVRANIHDNRFDAPSIGVAAATHGVLCNSTFGNTYLTIHDNQFNTAGAFGSAIIMADATHCHIAGNRVASQSAIQEASGADYNTYIGNDVTTFGAGAIQTSGAHSRAVVNPGQNPVGKITSPPAVAASGTAVTNSTGADCMVIVTLAAAATATSITIGGNATGITSSVASAVLPPVNVPAGQTITLTYTNAPTWTWWGD